MKARPRRLSARDASWLGVESVKVVGPLGGMSADAVRAALIDLHEHRPRSRFVCRLDVRGRRWLPLSRARFAAWVDRLVVPTDPDIDPDADDLAGWLVDDPLGDRPMLVAAGGRFAGFKLSHAAGDARAGDALFAAILGSVTTGRPAYHPYRRPVTVPLLRAAVHQFARRPARLPAAVRITRPPKPVRPVEAVAWQPRVARHSERSAAGLLPELRRWRDAYAPGVSVGAVLFSAAYAAIAQRLGAPDPHGVVVLLDARRYLPRRAVVEGNFAWGEHLTPADPADPRAMHAAIGDLVRSRRALTMLALHNARALLAPHGTPPAVVPARPRPHLAVTYLGRADAYAALTWLGAEHDRRLLDVVPPAGPQGVTVALEELGGALHVTTTFHDTVFDPDDVAAAMQALTKDPVGLLTVT